MLILADDFGYECVGANGGQSYQTPTLDKLAATGMRFEQCYVQPLCTPTRVQLMTGVYNVRNYIRFGLLDPQATTFANLLKQAGYATGIAGKWQLGQDRDLPQHFGFDESCLWQHTRRPPRYANPGLEINGVEKDHTGGEYGPEVVNQFALDFLTRHKDQPFLLYYPMILTHDPFQPTPDSPDWDPRAEGERVARDVKHFADMTACMDKMVGRVVDKLDELGLRENTLVVFLGDNGTHPSVTSRFQGEDYRGGKGSTNARGMHVPLIANWPGHIAPGQVNADLIDSTDFLPTLCEAAGVGLPNSLPVDGRSFLPQLLGRKGAPREWIYSWYARDGGPVARQEFAMSIAYKLYRDGRFFDLEADPFEQRPLTLVEASGPAATAAKGLQVVLDQYADARPAHLRQPVSGPAGDQKRPAKKGRAKKKVQESSADQKSPPNIVLIISDDQAWTDYGFMGHPVIQTPNLDTLAARSAVFTRGYVPTALCRPSLATLATGLYPHQHKISGNDPSPALAAPNSPEYAQLREQLIRHIDRYPTLPKLLAERGYLSHQSGKWWEGSFARGGFTHGMTRGFPEKGGRHGDDGLRIGREGMQPVFEFIDDAVDKQKPFFIWYAPFLPHAPHNPPERLLARYRHKVDSLPVAKYYAMCEWFDETCGQLLDYLGEKGLTRDTLVVYIGDNGWIQDPNGTGAAPRSKQSPNEGGVRQPILLSWPGTIAPQTRDELVSSIDLMPTMLSAAGAPVPDNLPGVNLLPVVRDGRELGRDTIFGEGFAHDVADPEDPEVSLLYRWAIECRWKLLLTYDGKLGRYARVHPREERRPQLFDLIADPYETENLAAEHPEVVARLAEKIDQWWPVRKRDVQTSWTN